MASSTQINWGDYGSYQILDVLGREHEQVEQYMLERFRCCRLFQVLQFQQERGVERQFMKIVEHILKNECSIMVVDRESNEIKGVALLKCMSQEWRSWTALHLLMESERFKELYCLLRWCLQQESLHSSCNNSQNTLHLFFFHLSKELQEDKEFLNIFFDAICQVARHMYMPRVTYMGFSQDDHECMKSAGFRETVRVIYSLYVFQNRRPLDCLRDINEMHGGFYEKPVPPLKPYQEMQIRPFNAGANEKIKPKTKTSELEKAY